MIHNEHRMWVKCRYELEIYGCVGEPRVDRDRWEWHPGKPRRKRDHAYVGIRSFIHAGTVETDEFMATLVNNQRARWKGTTVTIIEPSTAGSDRTLYYFSPMPFFSLQLLVFEDQQSPDCKISPDNEIENSLHTAVIQYYLTSILFPSS